jgi:hypothetical protein
MDEQSKCSLPSISNLLGLADAGSPTSETSPQSQQQQAQSPQQQPQQHQQQQQQQQQAAAAAAAAAAQQAAAEQQLQQQHQQHQQRKPDTRPNSSHYGNQGLMRGQMPPTPPMTHDSFEGYPSPSTKSIGPFSVTSQPNNYYYETTPPLDEGHHGGHHGHHHQRSVGPMGVQRMSVQSAYPQPSFAAATSMSSSYMSQPMASYYPPMQPTPPPQVSGLYYQRPLPQQFPPLPVSVALAPSSGANPWQHHHYISPSSAPSFPQSQDRYICQTCNKAFSRPSSLRIHSHSHTGEKPFKCPHAGCGKAFSVRSNMKRHERGCHNFDSSSGSSVLS